MKYLLHTVLVIGITITFLTCNPAEPDNNQNLLLKMEDVSCIEAWLNIQTNNISLPAQINVTANSQPVNQLTLTTSDSLIVIDSLQPNSSYTFQATISNNISSNSVNAVTMDTTSHDFVWETFSFGEHSSSILYDVAIIDENNIWAVGKIYMHDSLGQIDPHAYNAVHWDGSNWTLKRIPFAGCGAVLYPPIYSVITFNENDIWFTRGGTVLNFNGSTYRNYCEINPLLTGSLNKLWGTSSNDLYAVGNNGNIVHYNGNSWQKIESPIGKGGTELNIQNVWGSIDPFTGEEEILCVASNKYFNEGNKIMQIKGDEVIELSNAGLPWSLSSLWFIKDKKYYISGDGIYEKSNLSENQWRNNPLDITSYYTHEIKGTSFNNIAAAGGAGEVLHFNGKNWKSFYNNTQLVYGNYYSLDIKVNTIVVVGQDTPRAVITIGKK
jgi:hypothetical protein